MCILLPMGFFLKMGRHKVGWKENKGGTDLGRVEYDHNSLYKILEDEEL